jgi:hypothetical protein
METLVMAETTNTHTQQMKDGFKKVVDDQAARIEGAFAEFAKIEARNLEQATAQLDEMTRLTKASMTYASELGAEWRKAMLDAARKTAEMMTGGGVL